MTSILSFSIHLCVSFMHVITRQPSRQPSSRPSNPSSQPSRQPTQRPSTQPPTGIIYPSTPSFTIDILTNKHVQPMHYYIVTRTTFETAYRTAFHVPFFTAHRSTHKTGASSFAYSFYPMRVSTFIAITYP